MSKLADTLRKDGWKLTPGAELKTGDYVAVMHSFSNACEGTITNVVDYKDGTFKVFYGEFWAKRLTADTEALWVAPKEYEHLEIMWDTDGTKYINISTKPRKPLFCLASLIELGLISAPRSQVKILDSRKDPDALLKEKPVTAEVHDIWANNTPQDQE